MKEITITQQGKVFIGKSGEGVNPPQNPVARNIFQPEERRGLLSEKP